MTTKNLWTLISTVTVLLSTAHRSAEANPPVVSYSALGTGTVQFNGTAHSVTDSDSTASPLDPSIAFSAQQELVPGQSGYRMESHGDASVYVIQSGLHLRMFSELELAYYPSLTDRPGGTGSGSVSSLMELDLPSESVNFSYALSLHAADFPRTVHIRAENITDATVLFDTTLAGSGSILLSGQEGDRIRVLLEGTVSGTAPAGSANMVGSLSLKAEFLNHEDCNGNGQDDDLDVFLGVGFDCNDNLILDSCDLAAGTSVDCNGNSVPDECETDCNNNGVQDTCDISAGTSTDCNQTGVPDECENLPDCNENLVVDICDVVNGTSEDCDESGVPDECEPPQPDCNNNTIGDGCDVRDGTSDDCNFDAIPDECQPDEDCNGNTVRDICDIGAGTAPDCNQNLVPDSCDIAFGTSLDADGNGVPDECPSPPVKGSDDKCVGGSRANLSCAQPSDCPGGACRLKNRFITFDAGSIGSQMLALKVVLTGLDSNSAVDFATFNGQVRYVQAPILGVSDGALPPFNAAILGCAYHAQNWSTVGQLHVYGSEIVPKSTYDVHACSSQSLCSQNALRIQTATFGDIVPPIPNVNFQDIYAETSKFQNSPFAPSKTRTKLHGTVFDPLTPVSFLDISADISAFQGKTFKVAFPQGPQTCP